MRARRLEKCPDLPWFWTMVPYGNRMVAPMVAHKMLFLSEEAVSTLNTGTEGTIWYHMVPYGTIWYHAWYRKYAKEQRKEYCSLRVCHAQPSEQLCG